MFQIDLNSDLKEEADLKSRCCFTLFEPVMSGSNLVPGASFRSGDEVGQDPAYV